MITLFSSRLGPLRHADNDASLAFFPQELTISEVILVILIFVGRQFLHLLGLGNRFLIKTVSGKNEESYELPELSVSMPFRLTEEDLKKFVEALHNGSTSSSGGSSAAAYRDPKVLLEQPAYTCFLLSAFSGPVMLLLLAHHDAPIRPLGAVNVRNRFEVLRPDLCMVEVLMKANFAVVATLVRQARKMKRGLEMDVVVEVVSYEQDVIFRQVFTMLQFMNFKNKPATPVHKTDGLKINELAMRGKLRPFSMSRRAPRAWATVCKDYNPIHISTLAAKLFGFRSTIAHGNHALAIALGQFESCNDFRFDAKGKPYSMEVHFRKPIVLPAALGALVVQEGDSECDFYVEQKGKICVSASLSRV